MRLCNYFVCLVVALLHFALSGCATVVVRVPNSSIEGYTANPTEKASHNWRYLVGDKCYCAHSDVSCKSSRSDSAITDGCMPYSLSIDPIEISSKGFNPRHPDNLAHAQEWKWNHDKTWPPKVCLALSGGGIRSAAFSIGVMSGLRDQKPESDKTVDVLGTVDVMSSVSGGSFALSWYLMQRHKHGMDIDPFDIRYIKYLADNARLVTLQTAFPYLLGDILLIPWNLLVNGIFGWHANTVISQWGYENRIADTFLTDINGDSGRNVSLDELGGKTEETIHPPFFIINTTTTVEDDSQHYGANLDNSVFEFTPLQFGSDVFGRWKYNEDRDNISIGKVVSISGAALDLPSIVALPVEKTLFSAANIDSGYYLANPAVHWTKRLRHKFLPFPFYLIDRYIRDINATDIYLADGGFSDNLGVFSLVRRGCEEIIIVDAEYDRNYNFEAYKRLKRELSSSIHVDLEVPAIDESIRLASTHNSYPEDGKKWQMFANKPVMQGTITFLPYSNGKLEFPGTINVTYVKLAYWEELKKTCSNDNISTSSVIHGYLCHSLEARKKTFVLKQNAIPNPPAQVLYDLFPQEPTTNQNYSPEQFNAYYELGRSTVIKYISDFTVGPKPLEASKQ